MKEYQIQISGVVKAYKRHFPDEYQEVVHIVKRQKENLHNEYADLTGSMNFIDRKLGEIPETLWNLLNMKISPESMAYFTTSLGSRWFYTKYPEFRVTKKI